MGLRATAEAIEDSAPMFRAAGVRRMEYAEDGSCSAIEWYPHDGDTEPAPPPSRMQRMPEIPPPPPLPSESGMRVSARGDARDDVTTDLVDRPLETEWLGTNGRW